MQFIAPPPGAPTPPPTTILPPSLAILSRDSVRLELGQCDVGHVCGVRELVHMCW